MNNSPDSLIKLEKMQEWQETDFKQGSDPSESSDPLLISAVQYTLVRKRCI